MTPRDPGRRWRTRTAIGLSALALAAIPLSLSSGHASAALPCSGYGGQGAAGFVISMAQSCATYAGTLVATPTPAPSPTP
jgi:hypothetical protein